MPQPRRKHSDFGDPLKLGLPKWMNARWRPAMAWLYIAVVFCDFIAFPIGNAALASAGYIPYQEWHPMTIQGGGIFHLAMGAVLGVTAWGQTQERVSWGGAPGYPPLVNRNTTVAAAPAPGAGGGVSSRAD